MTCTEAELGGDVSAGRDHPGRGLPLGGSGQDDRGPAPKGPEEGPGGDAEEAFPAHPAPGKTDVCERLCLMQADLKMQYSSQAMATGKTAFLKNSLMASLLVIGGASIPASIIPGKSDGAQGLWKVRQSAQSMLFQLSNMTKVHFETPNSFVCSRTLRGGNTQEKMLNLGTQNEIGNMAIKMEHIELFCVYINRNTS